MEVPSIPHLIMVLVIFALLFGAKRVPEIAGSLGKGIKEFKRNIRDEGLDPPGQPPLSEPVARPTEFVGQAPPVGENRSEPKRLGS